MRPAPADSARAPPDQPVIEPQPPNREIRDGRVKSFRKDERVDSRVVFVLAADFAALLDDAFPLRAKLQLFPHVQIDSLRNHQRPGKCILCPPGRPQKIAHENDVRVDVTHPGKTRSRFRLAEQIAEQRRSVIARRDIRQMPQPKLARYFRRALIIPQKNDFRPRLQSRPALDRVALDDADVPFERLWN